MKNLTQADIDDICTKARAAIEARKVMELSEGEAPSPTFLKAAAVLTTYYDAASPEAWLELCNKLGESNKKQR